MFGNPFDKKEGNKDLFSNVPKNNDTKSNVLGGLSDNSNSNKSIFPLQNNFPSNNADKNEKSENVTKETKTSQTLFGSNSGGGLGGIFNKNNEEQQTKLENTSNKTDTNTKTDTKSLTDNKGSFNFGKTDALLITTS